MMRTIDFYFNFPSPYSYLAHAQLPAIAADDVKVRMTMAGAEPINRIAVTAEWAPDYKSPERAALVPVWSQRGGAPAMLTDLTMAQVRSGIVPPQDFLPRGIGA